LALVSASVHGKRGPSDRFAVPVALCDRYHARLRHGPRRRDRREQRTSSCANFGRPKFPDAHRDPAWRAYLARRAEERIIGLVRWGTVEQPLGDEGMALFPPSLSEAGWSEKRGNVRSKNHSPEELLRALARPNAPLA
jgi:hypothetical protein